MANWRTFIDPSVGDGQNTINGSIAYGSTFGVGISDDLSVTGLSTFSDIARFSSTIRLDGQLRDGDNNFGSSGQVLSSDGTDTRWINAGSLSAGAASQVAINDDSNTNAERFITLVDSSSGNNNVKTDASLKYNPSTNTITTVNITGNVTGNLTGNASSATVLQTTRTIGGVSFNGSASINLPGVNQTGNQNTSGSSASCTGNSATATILQTTRTIGGVSFNGSENINLPGVNIDGNQNTSGNAGSATVLETTRNFSISGEITANAQSFNGSGNVTLSATVDDNVIDEANLKISNSPTNGRFLQCNTGVSGGLTWAEVTVPAANTLTGTTLASGITASSITSLGTLTGLSVNGNISVTTGAISGNGEGLTNLGANRLSSGTVSQARLPQQEAGISIVGNFGQWQGHNTYTNFNTEPTYWGWNFVMGTTNAPNTTSSQWYRCRLSLGSEYGKGSDSNDYSLEMAIPRNNQSSAGGLHIRAIENGSEQSWVAVGANASLLSTGTVPDARLANSSLFVTGMIMMYTGNSAPSGWAICDGSNGTPDLRARFIVGAGNGSGAGNSNYSVNNTGGAESVTLSTAQLPSHNHGLNNHTHSFSATTSNTNLSHDHDTTFDNKKYFPGGGSTSIGYGGAGGYPADVFSMSNALGDHNHTVSGTTGGNNGTTANAGSGNSHENRPPYYALMFIMKL